VALVDVSRRQRLDAIVRVVRLPRLALLGIEAAMRRAQPAVGDRRVGSVDPMNVSSLPPGSNTRSTRNKSASLVDDEMNSLAASGPVISVGRSRVIEKRTPGPSASYGILAGVSIAFGLRARPATSR